MKALTTAETWEGGARPAWPHELCTCGRPAELVYNTQRGETGYCSISAAAAEAREPHPIGGIDVEDSTSVLPCPFCGTDEPHLVVCPDYRVRPVS